MTSWEGISVCQRVRVLCVWNCVWEQGQTRAAVCLWRSEGVSSPFHFGTGSLWSLLLCLRGQPTRVDQGSAFLQLSSCLRSVRLQTHATSLGLQVTHQGSTPYTCTASPFAHQVISAVKFMFLLWETLFVFLFYISIELFSCLVLKGPCILQILFFCQMYTRGGFLSFYRLSLTHLTNCFAVWSLLNFTWSHLLAISLISQTTRSLLRNFFILFKGFPGFFL